MKKILLIIIVTVISIGCKLSKANAQNGYSEEPPQKNYTILELDNWNYYYTHNLHLYSPKDVIQKSQSIFSTYFSISVEEINNNNLIDYMKNEIEKKKKPHRRINHFNYELERFNNDFGNVLILKSTFNINGNSHQEIKKCFLYQEKIYDLTYISKEEYFNIYLSNANRMFDSFVPSN